MFSVPHCRGGMRKVVPICFACLIGRSPEALVVAVYRECWQLLLSVLLKSLQEKFVKYNPEHWHQTIKITESSDTT
jgi:hypothetical protein